MKDTFQIEYTLHAKAKDVFNAWLSSEEHTNMTGGKAVINSETGSEFTAWDGYIKGKNLNIILHQLIEQEWRTLEFPPDAENSHLKIEFRDAGEKVHVTLTHSNIPSGQGKNYKQGWLDHYFHPMEEYIKERI